jgi:hypothetical protein
MEAQSLPKGTHDKDTPHFGKEEETLDLTGEASAGGWPELIRQLSATVTDPARTPFLQDMERSVCKSAGKPSCECTVRVKEQSLIGIDGVDVPEAVYSAALGLLLRTVPRFTQPKHKRAVLSLLSSLQSRSQVTAGSSLENGFLKGVSKALLREDWAESL